MILQISMGDEIYLPLYFGIKTLSQNDKIRMLARIQVLLIWYLYYEPYLCFAPRSSRPPCERVRSGKYCFAILKGILSVLVILQELVNFMSLANGRLGSLKSLGINAQCSTATAISKRSLFISSLT